MPLSGMTELWTVENSLHITYVPQRKLFFFFIPALVLNKGEK